MKTYSLYSLDTGLFTGAQISASREELLDINTPDGHGRLEGAFDHLSQRVDLGSMTVVDYQPSMPSEGHVWDHVTKRWVPIAANKRLETLNAIKALEEKQPRIIRELLLHEGDDAGQRLQAIDDEIKELRRLL